MNRGIRTDLVGNEHEKTNQDRVIAVQSWQIPAHCNENNKTHPRPYPEKEPAIRYPLLNIAED